MNFILFFVEPVSGLKINFHKMEVLCFDKANYVEGKY
jgi:hypothetical protein